MLRDSQIDLCGQVDFTRTQPLLGRDEAFSFACNGCGNCCRGREDIVLSGFDLWRIAARLRLPPRIVAHGYCRESIGQVSRLPVLRLAPLKAQHNNCPFLTENHCAIHDAEPLVCALYPLAQEISGEGAVSYFLQPTSCGDVFCQGRGLSCPIRCPCPGGCGCLLGTDLHDAGGHCGGAEYDPLAGIGAAAGSKALASALLRL